MQMLGMKKFIMILLVAVLVLPFGAMKARAIDPITLMILAPVAVKAAEIAKPYIIKSVIGTGRGLIKISRDAFHILYLPLGLLEMTIGAPFKRFRTGVKHVIRGGVIAPIRLILHSFLLPAYMIGADINI